MQVSGWKAAASAVRVLRIWTAGLFAKSREASPSPGRDRFRVFLIKQVISAINTGAVSYSFYSILILDLSQFQHRLQAARNVKDALAR